VRHIDPGRALRWSLALLLAGLAGACGPTQKVTAPPPAAPEAEAGMEMPAPAPGPPMQPEETRPEEAQPEEAPPGAMPAEEAPVAAEPAPPAEAMPPAAEPDRFEPETSVEAMPPPPAEPETYEVVVPESQYAFIPGQLTIYEGDTVVWHNDSGVVHLFATIPGSDPTGRMEIEPEDLLVGGSVSHTFKMAGTYPYFCFIHNQMTGRIVVLPR
jgi:plastocyanin